MGEVESGLRTQDRPLKRMGNVGGHRHAEKSGFEATWRGRFLEFAEDQDDDAGIAGWTKTGLDARVRRFLGVWKPIGSGERWLDAGCGAGTYSRILKDRGATVVGVDYSPLAIRKAVARSGGLIAFAVADVRFLPFRRGSFDGAICFGVTQALSDSAPVVDQLASLVRPGGAVWIDGLNRCCVVHAVEMLRRKLAGRPVHLRYESPTRIKRLMGAAGMKNVALYWMPILPGRWRRAQAWVEAPLAQFLLRFVPLVGLFGCHAFIVCAQKSRASS